MRLRDYCGAVRIVTDVTPAVEERRVFNGSKRRILEPQNNPSVKPNALVFSFDNQGMSGFGFGCSNGWQLLIGNLSSEEVEKILSDLAEKDYADISGLKFQQKKINSDEYVFDDAKSAPYYYMGFNVYQNGTPNIFGTNFSSCPNGVNDLLDEEDGDSDDISSFSDEALRETLHELGDYTFLQLGQMNRAELEEEYEKQEVMP